MENTPFKCVKINALKRDPRSADPAQGRLLEIKAVERAGQPVQAEGIVKAPDAGHIAGVAEQHRTSMFVYGVMLNEPVGAAFGQILRKDLIQFRFPLRVA